MTLVYWLIATYIGVGFICFIPCLETFHLHPSECLVISVFWPIILPIAFLFMLVSGTQRFYKRMKERRF